MPLTDLELFSPPVRQLYDYWRGIAPVGALPGRQHFDPVDIPNLLPHLWLLDVVRDPLRLRCRLVGSGVRSSNGRLRPDCWLDELFDAATMAEVTAFVTPAIEAGESAWRRGRSIMLPVERSIDLEVIALPLAADGRCVDMLLNMTIFSWETGWQPTTL